MPGPRMGLIRFAVHPASLMEDWPEVYRGYLSGADGRVFPTRIEVDGQVVGCGRTTSESSKFHVAFPVPGFGRPVVITASLPEREQPYLLVVELARGKIVQMRNQASAWELAGMQIPAAFTEPSKAAHRAFARAASSQTDPETATGLATEALHHAFRAAEILTMAYATQALAGRLQRFGSIPSSVGCELQGSVPDQDANELFTAAFNAATVAVPWRSIEAVEGEYNWEPIDRQLEWCEQQKNEQQKLLVRGGPLIDLGPDGLPDWLARWKHDVFNLRSFICDFVETAISRYVGRIRVWEVVARGNSGGALTMSEENRLMLTASVLGVAKQIDEEAQLIIRVDQPWGDYVARGQHRLSPLQFVDALHRSGVGLAGVNLELAMGYLPRGSARRDLLDIARLIDSWSVLNLPIQVTLAVPSSGEDDPLSYPDWEVEPRLWPTGCSDDNQAECIDRVTELLLAKQSVAGVFLSHFSDANPHQFPFAGVLRADGTPKPALERIITQRQRHKRRA
jgi:GH35 family endo-1,4-beta-xylanase